MIVGFAVSTVVPARAGELARAEWLGRRTGLPRASVARLDPPRPPRQRRRAPRAAWPSCRSFCDVPLWLRPGAGSRWRCLRGRGRAGGLRCCGRAPGRPASARSRQPRRAAAAVAGFLARARLGLAASQTAGPSSRLVRRVAGGLGLEINVVFFTLRAVGLHLPLGASLLVLVAVNLALVVPFAPPGNLGTARARRDPGPPGVRGAKEQALAFALCYHLLQVVPIGILGLALASRSLLRPRRSPSAGSEAA